MIHFNLGVCRYLGFNTHVTMVVDENIEFLSTLFTFTIFFSMMTLMCMPSI
jgi:hypothetical protein